MDGRTDCFRVSRRIEDAEAPVSSLQVFRAGMVARRHGAGRREGFRDAWALQTRSTASREERRRYACAGFDS